MQYVCGTMVFSPSLKVQCGLSSGEMRIATNINFETHREATIVATKQTCLLRQNRAEIRSVKQFII